MWLSAFDQADIEIDTRFQSEGNAWFARVLNAAFRDRLVGETGHSWPPPSGISFPLKDW